MKQDTLKKEGRLLVKVGVSVFLLRKSIGNYLKFLQRDYYCVDREVWIHTTALMLKAL